MRHAGAFIFTLHILEFLFFSFLYSNFFSKIKVQIVLSHTSLLNRKIYCLAGPPLGFISIAKAPPAKKLLNANVVIQKLRCLLASLIPTIPTRTERREKIRNSPVRSFWSIFKHFLYRLVFCVFPFLFLLKHKKKKKKIKFGLDFLSERGTRRIASGIEDPEILPSRCSSVKLGFEGV